MSLSIRRDIEYYGIAPYHGSTEISVDRTAVAASVSISQDGHYYACIVSMTDAECDAAGVSAAKRGARSRGRRAWDVSDLGYAGPALACPAARPVAVERILAALPDAPADLGAEVIDLLVGAGLIGIVDALRLHAALPAPPPAPPPSRLRARLVAVIATADDWLADKLIATLCRTSVAPDGDALVRLLDDVVAVRLAAAA